jgi:preprotein translocase subunit SecA
LEEDNISEAISDLISEEMHIISEDFVPLESVESQWRLAELDRYLTEHYLIEVNIQNQVNQDKKLTPELIADLISNTAASRYKEKYISIEQNIAQLEKQDSIGRLINFSSFAQVPKSINLHLSEQKGLNLLTLLRSAEVSHWGHFLVINTDS